MARLREWKTRSMQSKLKIAARVLVIAVAATIVGAAAAQQVASRGTAARSRLRNSGRFVVAQARAAATGTGQPQRTTATYADWVVQCETLAGRTPAKVCDMAQVTEVKGRDLPFSRISVSFPGHGDPVKLTVQVPVNVSFSTSVHIQTSQADPGVVAPFSHCIPAGCFADFALKDDILKKLRAAHGAGRLSFADSAGRQIVIPMSFNGFNEAFQALTRE